MINRPTTKREKGRLRLEKRKIFFVKSANRKFYLMGKFHFMSVFTSDQMTGNGIAFMNSYKRIEGRFM